MAQVWVTRCSRDLRLYALEVIARGQWQLLERYLSCWKDGITVGHLLPQMAP
jgi:hypothetical protein